MSGEPPVELLLVDDEPRNIDVLEAILDGQGYRILRAHDADSALHTLLEHDVAAIVLDIQMPGVSGIELAKMIKGTRRYRQIPIVFLTAHMVEDADVITGYGVGAVDYLTKPVNTQILRHKIAVFADLFRTTRALAELNDKLEERVRERTAELEKSEVALRAASRQKDEFLAVLAHELRNPLAPLRTGLDLLAQIQPPTTPAATKTMATMNRQVDHIVRLIDDLLDVSRISRGALELKKQRADLATIIQNTVDTHRAMLDAKKLDLTLSLQHAVSAEVDATRISQILGNLLHNASKFTPDGGSLRVELGLAGTDAVIRVIDSGVGIPEDQLERVFEMFARVERKLQSTDRGGAGIGLALARRLAQMHGGGLVATSAGEGQGTTVTLTLPNAESVEVPQTAPRSRRKTVENPLDILVIEDNEDAADTLALWLEKQGHTVQIARTGPTGLSMVLDLKPDLVLCDVGLPGMDGVEVCQKVREATQAAPGPHPIMVALTGWGMEEDRRRTKDAGFDHHLVKPVSLDLLADVLKNASR